MARQWMIEGIQVHEDGTEEFMAQGVQFNEDDGGAAPDVWDASKLAKFIEDRPDRAKGRRVVAY
jgi:hypothetical protein